MTTVYIEKLRRDSIITLIEQLNQGQPIPRREMLDKDATGRAWGERVIAVMLNRGLVEREGAGNKILYRATARLPTDESLIQVLLHPKKAEYVSSYGGEDTEPDDEPDEEEPESKQPTDPIALLLTLPRTVALLEQKIDAIDQKMDLLFKHIAELHHEFFPNGK
jgi:hypothetical protein